MRARLKLLLAYLLYWLAFFTVARLVFLLFYHREAAALSPRTLAAIFRHGLPLDLSSTAYVSLIPFLLVALPVRGRGAQWVLRVLLGYTAIVTAALSLLAAADLGVYRDWGRRIDAAVLQYLTHPREIWASAGGGPRVLFLAIFAALTVGFVTLARRILGGKPPGLAPIHPAGTVLLVFCAMLLVIPGRGGVQQIPINQSSAYFSTEPFANQAALNAGWNFFDSWIKGLNRHTNPYVVMPADSARALVDPAGIAAGQPVGGDTTLRPLLSVQRPSILLIVWESFTARSVERLGGVPGATPQFDSLAGEGLLFRRFYAAGDRTEKGLGALLAGAPTIPKASILKVPSKAATLPMLSRDLTGAGYSTAFYYGGELGFANIKSFVLSGGFGRVLGKDDFPQSTWSSKWGAHDGPVAERLLSDLRAMPAPFFTTWLTLSSHEPFDVPGPVRVRGSDAESRFLNSLAYTDHVLGDFVRRAKREPWWDRTLVVIVADHSKKLERTDAAVPYKSAESWYHIPMLWTGGALARHGENVDRLGGQTDLAPTLLAALGLPGGRRYRFGRDLFAGAARGWAYYGFDDGFGLVTGEGSLVWEHIPNRITSRTGQVGEAELRLGRAMLQLTYQDYLDR
jgi:phosphoglycerol transferase MdoB-like AlkP superfamily enzyme